MPKFILTHDSHKLKKGTIWEGDSLPLWLAGKARPVSDDAFEVATPGADIKKLSAELETANENIKALTDEKASLSAELETAKKQIADLQAQATAGKGK